MDLRDKIESREAVVSVIGLGHVGLPLAVEFAETGFRVVGVDVDRSRVDAVNSGSSYVQDVSSEMLARCASRLSATTSYDALRDVDAVIICVPTPLSKTRDPRCFIHCRGRGRSRKAASSRYAGCPGKHDVSGDHGGARAAKAAGRQRPGV